MTLRSTWCGESVATDGERNRLAQYVHAWLVLPLWSQQRSNPIQNLMALTVNSCACWPWLLISLCLVHAMRCCHDARAWWAARSDVRPNTRTSLQTCVWTRDTLQGAVNQFLEFGATIVKPRKCRHLGTFCREARAMKVPFFNR